MNITLTIQDITPRELAALMSAMEGLQTPAATPVPEPQPQRQPAKKKPGPGKGSTHTVIAYSESGETKVFNSISEALKHTGVKTPEFMKAVGKPIWINGWSFKYPRGGEAPMPAPEPQPTPAPAEEHGQTVQARLMAEREARKEREEKEHAETLVVGENGIREPLGKALERLQEEKRAKGPAAKAVIGHHDDGDVRYWANASEAAASLGVSTVLIYKAIQECRKVRGWMLEYDEKWKGGAA